MNKMTLMFLILRKNVNQLRQYLKDASTTKACSARRQHIIDLKRELASLKPSNYLLLKTIATEINRFTIKSIVKNFVPSNNPENQVIQYLIQDSEIVLRTETRHMIHRAMQQWMYGSDEEPERTDPWIVYDKIHNIHFLLYSHYTEVDGVTLFAGKEHDWFIDVYKALEAAKEAEELIMKQQREHEEKLREERKKEGILSKYS